MHPNNLVVVRPGTAAHQAGLLAVHLDLTVDLRAVQPVPPSIATIREQICKQQFDETTISAWSTDPRVGVRALARTASRALRMRQAQRERFCAMSVRERALWASGITHVAGVDEVGAGPLAGPVVAAAVILPQNIDLPGLNDSKQVPRKAREQFALRLRDVAIAIGFGQCSPVEIDALNILQAACRAMQRAIAALPLAPEHILVDARTIPDVRTPQEAIIKGDAMSISIAAASIVAKVERDAIMKRLAADHPGYGFEVHAGYGTAQHLQALRRLGPSPIHRRSFEPVAVLERSSILLIPARATADAVRSLRDAPASTGPRSPPPLPPTPSPPGGARGRTARSARVKRAVNTETP